MYDWGSEHSLVVGNQKFSKVGHFLGKKGIYMFSLPILKGDRTPLKDPTSIVLTEELVELATALFGNQHPIGKILKMASNSIIKMTPIFDKYNPGFPFECQFTNKQYAKKINYIELMGNLSLVVAF